MTEYIQVLAFDTSYSEKSSISNPIDIKLKFKVLEDLQNVHWSMRYIVDVTHKRHNIELYKTEETSYSKDQEYSIEYASSSMKECYDVPPSWMQNTGLLKIEMYRNDEVLFGFSCVSIVIKENNEIFIQFLSPLE